MEADPETIKQAVKDLEIDVPVHVARVVGGRLELIVQGGIHYQWDGQPPVTTIQLPADVWGHVIRTPEACSKKQLMNAAKALNIPGRGRMTKAELVKAIQKWRDVRAEQHP